MTRQSTVDKPKTRRISHQPKPVCALRKLVGFADKSTSVVPTQTQTLYFGTDILGSVRNVTDKYGAVQANYNYDVFGAPYLSNLDNEMSFGYCGKTYDNGTGLYDYGFRDYSPNQARFTTVDPIRDGANWFSYVVNDPVNYIDPFGLTSTDVENYTYQGERDGRRYYTANKEATMWGLANDTGTALSDVQGYDGDPHKMPIGTELSIPAKPSTPTPPSQPAPSAPAPEAPAPAAPAPTVPTPSVPSAPPVNTGNLSSPDRGHSSGNFNNSNSYIQRSAEQIILGNYTDEVTLLGTAIQILMGVFNFDVLADIRDLSADFVNWEWSKQHILYTSLDLVALLPILGILKNTDEAAALVKNGKKASAAGKGAGILSAGGDPALRALRRPTFDAWLKDGIGDTGFTLNKHTYNTLFSSGRRDIMPDDLLGALSTKPTPGNPGSVVYTNPVSGTQWFVNPTTNDVVGVWPSTFK